MKIPEGGNYVKKISKLVPCLFGSIIFLTGCGSSIPEMTEEQNQIVTEYAAGLLLKYDKNYQSMLVDTTLIEETILEEPIKEEDVSLENNDSVISENEAVIENIEPVDMAQFLGLDGITIDYTGFLVCDSYPGELDEELFLAMDAADNYKLVVFMFDVTNLLAEEKFVDLLTLDTRYRFYLNEGRQNNALTTMLPDDLATFKDILQPNETKKLVLVIEVGPEIAENITDISLVIKLANDNATILLQP